LAENIFPHFFASKKGYLPLFSSTKLFIGKSRTMKQTIYYREKKRMPEEQRRKISEALKGRKKDPQTKKAISRGLKRYWSNVVWEDEGNGQAD
jgi:hypothetical protein